MNRSLKRNITIGFGAALALLLVVVVVSFRSIRQFISNNRWEEHTRQVLTVIAEVASDMKDADAAGRGHVISGDEQYLAAYRAAAVQVQSKVRELRTLTADNPRQQQRLDRLEPMIREKLAFVGRVAEVRSRQGFAAARQLLLGQGERLTQEVQQGLGQMRDEEDELLRVRSAAAVASARATTAVISSGGAIALLLVGLAGLLIRRDITSRRRAEEELNQFFTLSLDMLCIAGADGYFKRVSPVWVKTLGFSQEELLATPYIELIHPDDRAATRAEAEKLAGGGRTLSFENRYRCEDGSYRWLLWTAAPAAGGKLIYAAGRDITDRKRTEAALREAEERLRLLLEGVPDYAIFMLDPDGHVASWNTGAQRIKGYTAEEIVGQHFSRFYTPEDLERGKPQRELAVAMEKGRYEEERWRVRKDGSRFWANVIISAVHDQAGKLRGFAKVTRDVTERKRAEDDIKKLNESLRQHAARLEDANKELEAFSYSVSHDLRAPLRSIDGFSLALMEDYADKLDGQARDYLQRVRAATQRMAQLIDDLLGLSRVTRGELSRFPVDLSAVARAVAAELQKAQPDRQTEFAIADGLVAEADPRLVRVVLDNLLGNAWKFTSKRGAARIEFGACGENGKRQFFVRDNGAGFDMAYAHKLFGAFQRLHGNGEFAGNGVGLATVQRIIHRHGGRVWAEGEVEKGATFRFTL